MTSSDIRDMLNLPRDAPPRPKAKKPTAPRTQLRGLAREVHSLGGDNPIAIVPESLQFKKKRFASRKPAAKWEQRPFKNSARGEDGLVLRHWRRKPEERGGDDMDVDGQENGEGRGMIEDSMFAKYNVRVNVMKYTDEQYAQHLVSEDWTKEETDYLIQLIEDHDLRWTIIWDRYEYVPPAPAADVVEGAVMQSLKPRSLEDLKARYYSIAAKLMELNKAVDVMGHAEFKLHEQMANFNPVQETNRKKFAEAAMTRTKEEANEEQSLLVELKRILARTEKLNEERRELYATLEAPLSSSAVGIYTSSQGLQQLLAQLMSVDKNKKRRSLMGPEGSSPTGAQNAAQQAYDHRRESGHRDSMSGPGSASTLKKGSVASTGQGQSERRRLTTEEETVYGVSHPERCTSGPSFRSERTAKVLTSKSTAQQGKINNVLIELGITPILLMPTEDVGKTYEALIHTINQMVDIKKTVDKLSGEIAIFKEAKAERERRQRIANGEVVEEQAAVPEEATQQQQGGDVVMEDADAAGGSRAGSVRKRSVSVLSTMSEKSATKKQKK